MVALVYYGVTLSVGSLPGSIYVNFMFNGFSDALAVILTMLALPRFGRKRSFCVAMMIGGVAYLCSVIPQLLGQKGDDLENFHRMLIDTYLMIVFLFYITLRFKVAFYNFHI